MPRTKSKTEEIDEIVDDLEDLADEDLDEVVAEDPDEAPKKGRSKKAAKPKKEKTGVGTKEVADIIGTTPRELRMFLRAQGYQPKEDREGRYEWASTNDPEVKRIVKEFSAKEKAKANEEATTEAKGRKTRAKKAVEEDEEEE